MDEPKKQDMFDRLMALPVLNILEPFYARHKEALLYLFFGGLAFVVSMVSFSLFYYLAGLNELTANVLSWIFAVLFAFFTNRIWVFAAPTQGAGAFVRQIMTFFSGRLATLGVEELILLVFVTWLSLPAIFIKIVAQVVVILLNYVISKKLVFIKS